MRWIAAIWIGALLTACGSRSPAPIYDRSANPYRRAAESDSRIDRPSYYNVDRGDTLYAIAWRYGLDFKELARWNGIAPPYTIFPGERLRLNRPRVLPKVESAETYALPQKSAPRVAATDSKTTGRDKQGTDARTAESKPVTKAPARVASVSKPAPSGRIDWQWPANGKVVKTFNAGDSARRGIDISGQLGQDVRAAADGEVVYSGSGLVGYGELVIIKHDERFLSAYGHNRKRLVKEGERVAAGQTIAEMGQTGASSPRLHFEIRDSGKPVNPQLYLPRR